MVDRKLALGLLQEIEAEIKALDLWEAVRPSDEAFESQVPFFMDTLNFVQWLQWVFLDRFRVILANGLPLPTSCSIASMAEEALQGMPVHEQTLIDLLKRFDDLFVTAFD